MLLLDVLTWQVSWPGDLDLYFVLQCLLHILVDVQYLLNYKAYNHQTLHSASPQCMDSEGTLIEWPWPIFCAPLTFTPFTSPFHMSSTVRPSTTKSYIAGLWKFWNLNRSSRWRWRHQWAHFQKKKCVYHLSRKLMTIGSPITPFK